MLQSAGRGRVTAVVLQVLTKPFDTLNQDTLLDLRGLDFGIRGLVLACFFLYFDDDRTESTEIDGATLEPINVKDVAIQGSVVGSKLFIKYVNTLRKVAEQYGVRTFLSFQTTTVSCQAAPANLLTGLPTIL